MCVVIRAKREKHTRGKTHANIEHKTEKDDMVEGGQPPGSRRKGKKKCFGPD